jgi:hypothetical protein
MNADLATSFAVCAALGNSTRFKIPGVPSLADAVACYFMNVSPRGTLYNVSKESVIYSIHEWFAKNWRSAACRFTRPDSLIDEVFAASYMVGSPVSEHTVIGCLRFWEMEEWGIYQWVKTDAPVQFPTIEHARSFHARHPDIPVVVQV